MSKKLKILFCSSEVVPFAKTGGLADVAGALPIALEAKGYEVKVALPKYKCVKQTGKTARMGKDIEVYLIENDSYFKRDELYGDQNGDYSDNLARFTFFCSQVLGLIKKENFVPDIIHCNDWQTGLIPAYLKIQLNHDPFFNKIKTVFTIHNLAYQGVFPEEEFVITGLDRKHFNMHELEFYGKLNLLKGGLIYSDLITTVSPTYAQEIQTWQFGCGLDGVLRERKKNLAGIINGLDYAAWDPAVDNEIFYKYTKDSLEAKAKNKQALQRELNLPVDKNVPILGIVTRLAQQKGLDILSDILEKIARLNLQFVLLGTGDAQYHKILEGIKQKQYKNFSINVRFDAVLARKIYAGSDMFLMPSHYEPCGLGQLISFRYGTIPIARKTGGLADTVTDYNHGQKTGNGFVFEKYASNELYRTIVRAIEAFEDKESWQALCRRVMQYNFSWDSSAEKYVQLYNRVVNEKQNK